MLNIIYSLWVDFVQWTILKLSYTIFFATRQWATIDGELKHKMKWNQMDVHDKCAFFPFFKHHGIWCDSNLIKCIFRLNYVKIKTAEKFERWFNYFYCLALWSHKSEIRCQRNFICINFKAYACKQNATCCCYHHLTGQANFTELVCEYLLFLHTSHPEWSCG